MGSPSSETELHVTPEGQRYELQSFLGEYHGLLTSIVQRLHEYLQKGTIENLLADIDNAFPGVSVAFGEVQSELNTGRHDSGLQEVALTSEQLKPKLRGFRFNRRRFYASITNLPANLSSPRWRTSAKHAMRAVKWGNIIVGSLSKELSKFRGAEVIKEFGEVMAVTLEQMVDDSEAEESG